MKISTFKPGERLSGFIVGLSNEQPVPLSPPPNYTECGRGPANTSSGETYYVECAANQLPKRYVLILLPRTEYLHFGELEVCGEGKSVIFFSFSLQSLYRYQFEFLQLTVNDYRSPCISYCRTNASD
jgi:hypothetical protein